jgi:hypothetical protein
MRRTIDDTLNDLPNVLHQEGLQADKTRILRALGRKAPRHRSNVVWMASAAAFLIAVVAIATEMHQLPNPHVGKPNPNVSKRNTASKPQHPSQKYDESLTVGGKTISASGNSGIEYHGLHIWLTVRGVDANHPYGQSVVGNHSQIVTSRLVRTVNGLTYEALSEQTQPAASGSNAVQYFYWLVVYRPDPSTKYPSEELAYCIVGTPLDGTPSAADQATMLSLLPGWKVPPTH